MKSPLMQIVNRAVTWNPVFADSLLTHEHSDTAVILDGLTGLFMLCMMLSLVVNSLSHSFWPFPKQTNKKML